MRWCRLFCLLLVEFCACFARSVKARHFRDFDFDADSKSSASGADESANPSNEAKESLDVYESATDYNVNEERRGNLALLKQLFSSKSRVPELKKNEMSPDEKLLQLVSVLSPKTIYSNGELKLSSWPTPRDLFIGSQFSHADVKSDRIIVWLKYLDTLGRKNGLSDNVEHRFEAFSLLMSIDGVHEKDLARLFKRAKTKANLQTLSNNMADVVKQASQLRTLLKKKTNTPEAVFRKLQVKVSREDMHFYQWLWYCQLYKTKYNMNEKMLVKDGVGFDNRIVDVLKKEKASEKFVQLFTSICGTTGLTAFVDQLLTAVRGQKWLEEGKVPKDLNAQLIQADIPLHEQLPNLVTWFKFLNLYHKDQVTRSGQDVVNNLAPETDIISLFDGAALLDNLKGTDADKGIVADASKRLSGLWMSGR